MWKKRLFFLLLAGVVLWPLARDEALPADAQADLPAEMKYIALTFDDGPRRGTTERLLDGLRERGVHATFFLIGRQIPENTVLVQRMAEDGHQLGLHTYDHVEMTKLTSGELLHQMAESQQAMEQAVGEGDFWLRPPYGSVNGEVRSQAGVPVITWSIDPEDWLDRDADRVVAHVLQNARDGDIILMHDIFPESVDAALRLVDALRQRGFTFVTVAQLLPDAQPGVVYRRAD